MRLDEARAVIAEHNAGKSKPGAEGYRRYAHACIEVGLASGLREGHAPRQVTQDSVTHISVPPTMDMRHLQRRAGETDAAFVARVTAAARDQQARDQATGNREGGSGVRADYTASFGSRGEHSEMGDDPGGEVGPVVVAVLPGPVTAYGILTDETGRTVLVRHSDIDGQHDPGRALTGSFTSDAQRFRLIARKRAKDEQRHNKEWAQNISNFWKRQQARARG
jgi:hypothetical protein